MKSDLKKKPLKKNKGTRQVSAKPKYRIDG